MIEKAKKEEAERVKKAALAVVPSKSVDQGSKSGSTMGTYIQ